MKVEEIPAGKYIGAVSGGVDSVVLLDILSQQKNLELVVAHFDHGIRKESNQDKVFVENLAKRYKLPFEFAIGELGANASEEIARQARYAFLRSVQAKHKATAIITAHHQDDVLETIFINLLRGTKRRGLSSLQSSSELLRPLLRINKHDIKHYASEHQLQWREDATNQDPKYMRNWIRLNLMPKLSAAQKEQLLRTNLNAAKLNAELEEIIEKNFGTKKSELPKKSFMHLPHNVACEVMADWLRNNDIREFDSQTIERLVIGGKTLTPGKTIEIKKDSKMRIEKDCFKIVR